MARLLPSAAALAAVSLSAVALFPVFARDLEGFEFTDPLDLVIPAEPAAAIEPSAPSLEPSAPALEPADQSDLAIVELEVSRAVPPPPPQPLAPLWFQRTLVKPVGTALASTETAPRMVRCTSQAR